LKKSSSWTNRRAGKRCTPTCYSIVQWLPGYSSAIDDPTTTAPNWPSFGMTRCVTKGFAPKPTSAPGWPRCQVHPFAPACPPTLVCHRPFAGLISGNLSQTPFPFCVCWPCCRSPLEMSSPGAPARWSAEGPATEGLVRCRQCDGSLIETKIGERQYPGRNRWAGRLRRGFWNLVYRLRAVYDHRRGRARERHRSICNKGACGNLEVRQPRFVIGRMEIGSDVGSGLLLQRRRNGSSWPCCSLATTSVGVELELPAVAADWVAGPAAPEFAAREPDARTAWEGKARRAGLRKQARPRPHGQPARLLLLAGGRILGSGRCRFSNRTVYRWTIPHLQP